MERLVTLEADVLYQELPLPGELEFAYRSGPTPVLISAPHGAVHLRTGERKEEEEYTAAFAQLAAEQTGAHVIYLRRRCATDPSWYRGVPYKHALARVVRQAGIRCVLDIHGAAKRRDFGIALGTMGGTSCPPYRDMIIAQMESCGFLPGGSGLDRLDVDGSFTGNGRHEQETITRFVWQSLHTPVAQFELNEQLRVAQRRPDSSLEAPFRAHPADLERTLAALVRIVRSVSETAGT